MKLEPAAEPSLDGLLECAMLVVQLFGIAQTVGRDELLERVKEVLNGRKAPRVAADRGLITRREASNLFLAELESWLVRRAGLSWTTKPAIGDDLAELAERALFPPVVPTR